MCDISFSMQMKYNAEILQSKLFLSFFNWNVEQQ